MGSRSSGAVPDDVLEAVWPGLFQQRHHDPAGVGRIEAEEEDIVPATLRTFQNLLPERPNLVASRLFACCPQDVIYSVAARSIYPLQPLFLLVLQ